MLETGLCLLILAALAAIGRWNYLSARRTAGRLFDLVRTSKEPGRVD